MERIQVTLANCWEWTLSRNSDGYGRAEWEDVQWGAHRLAAYVWGLLPYPKFPMSICHTCDNPSCCNPSHLFMASHRTNMRDMTAKGRHGDIKGSKHGKVRLTEEQVLQIRKLHSEGLGLTVIGKQFGCNRDHIYSITSRKTWKHV